MLMVRLKVKITIKMWLTKTKKKTKPTTKLMNDVNLVDFQGLMMKDTKG